MADPSGPGHLAEVGGRSADIDALLGTASGPVVIRKLADDWPLVHAGRKGGRAARDYLLRHARSTSFTANYGLPGVADRLFYTDDMAMNFRVENKPLEAIFNDIEAGESVPDPPFIYLSSIDIADAFEGLAENTALDLGGRVASQRIWIGNRTRIAAHNDIPDNLAVCAVGRRIFTIFPPEQIANLYLGPIEHNPAGRPVSMVDFKAPDFPRFPRFEEALRSAFRVELEPGDAIHVPSMWYHHVESLDPFNVLINYWWKQAPRWLGDPELALFHAMLALRDLPHDARMRWQMMFDHYVFSGGADAAAHVPDGKRGILDPLNPASAQLIRTRILRGLS
ncbi:MAG: cupin-like domain-containing protein [Pseudomonadota bacterium]